MNDSNVDTFYGLNYCFYFSFCGAPCSFSTRYIYSRSTLPAQVLRGLAAAAAPVEPFRLQDQYVSSIAKAKAEHAEAPDEHESEAEAAEVAPPNGAPKSKPKKKSDWDYKSIRDNFISQKKAEGYTYSKAKSLWDNSSEKASFLGSASLQELKKRKFVPKGSTSNPWATKA